MRRTQILIALTCLLILLSATAGAQEAVQRKPGQNVDEAAATSSATSEAHVLTGEQKLDFILDLAHTAAQAGDLSTAERLFLEVESSEDPWYSWAATSGLVATYRMVGDFDSARHFTQRARLKRSDVGDLMTIWDGDTALIEGDFSMARAQYESVSSKSQTADIDGISVAAIALKQLGRLALLEGDAGAAAAVQRRLLRQFPQSVEVEYSLAQAMVFDTMATGALPIGTLEGLLHEEVCTEEEPCLISSGILHKGAVGGVRLASIAGIRFMPSGEDLDLMHAAKRVAMRHSRVTTKACSVTAASDGFQEPMPNDHSGWEFMDSIAQGYHPGLDINGPGSCDSDCDTIFKAVAKGCVRDSSPSNWGSAIIEHYYLPDTWYSQYGHASTIYYSTGSAITKGASLGKVGDVGTDCCHLHHEIRESDHPDATNADYYSSLTWTNVGDWYQNPFPFIDGHKAYSYVRWADEGAFTRYGSWTYVSGVGDRDDMRWAYTTSTGSKTNYVTYTFTAPYSGTYELWAFVPYNHATSSQAAYKVARTGGSTVFSGTVSQISYSDAWVYVGSGYLSASTSYYVEVATNTGESSKKVGLDDILLIKP